MNLLTLTDVYKMGHMEQYPEGTTKIYSYLHTRSDKKYNEIVVYGLKYLLKKYFIKFISDSDVDNFIKLRTSIIGDPKHPFVRKLYELLDLGYIPLEIKTFPEGTVLPAKSVIATVTNTHPDFYWVVGFFESLLLHAWYPITVASASRKYWKLVTKYADLTCDNCNHIPYSVHDFGYRGVSSEESAAIGGSAHLIHFEGTDTISAVAHIAKNYGDFVGSSVPASEHSVMCLYGREDEIKAFERMLDLYPTGVVSIVSDSYDFFNAITNIAFQLKDKILARDGKVVFRPDSGIPYEIINGVKDSDGALTCLGRIFGYTINSKGYKVLNPKVGLIYGDGMYYEEFERILNGMQANGWASSNLVIGVGGILLQSHSRDDLGFSFKATYAEINHKSMEIFKDPITDTKKKSMKGLIKCSKTKNGYQFYDQQTWEQEKESGLETVFLNGKLTNSFKSDTWNTIRKRVL